MFPLLLAENWYEQGNWPLVGAIAGLLVSQVFAYWQMLRQSRESLAVQVKVQRIDLISEQLAQFYNPLYALLAANGSVTEHLGPHSFPQDEIRGESAALNWKSMKDRVILPNNKQIADILRSKTHLMSASDDICHYLDLNNHIMLYEVFNERPTEAYERFRFPGEIVEHLKRKRTELMIALNELKSVKQE